MGAKIGSPPAFQRPSGYMYLSAGQLNLVDTVATLVNLDQIPAGFVDGIENVATHRITPGIAGRYSIFANVCFENPVVSKRYATAIYVSGFQISRQYGHASVVGELNVLCILPNIYLTAANYVELWAVSFSGGNTVDILIGNTSLAVQRVR